jgi:hypothetical protein
MNRNIRATILATVAVIAVLILGFRFLGSPARQRLLREDSRTVQALAALAGQINYAWNRSEKVLPANLDKITGTVKKDALTGKPFLYHPKQDSAYELCATFVADSRELPDTNTADPWLHPKGDYCFQLDASQPVPAVSYNYYY